MAANHGELKPYKVGHAPLFGQLWAYGRWIIYTYICKNKRFLSISMVDGGATILAGWWFGTFFYFSIYLGISSSQPTNSYFSEGFKPPTSKNINNFYQFLIYPPQIHNLQCNWGCCPERSVHRFTSQPSEQWLNPLLDLLVGDSQEVIPVFYGNVNRTDS